MYATDIHDTPPSHFKLTLAQPSLACSIEATGVSFYLCFGLIGVRNTDLPHCGTNALFAGPTDNLSVCYQLVS